MYADRQKSRIAQEGRVRSATVEPSWFEGYIAAEREQEQQLGRMVERTLHSVAPPGVLAWVAATPGIGDKLLGRLLGHLGHPRQAHPMYWEQRAGGHGDKDDPQRRLVEGDPFERTVGQLWQYCGHGEAGRRRVGMTQEEAFPLGNPRCKMLTHLLAESVVKAQVRKHSNDPEQRVASGALGQYYLDEKAKYATRVHTKPCSGGYVSAGPGRVVFAKCKLTPPANEHANTQTGPAGGTFYAMEGDPYSKGHINAIALRHLGKQVLRELWEAAG